MAVPAPSPRAGRSRDGLAPGQVATADVRREDCEEASSPIIGDQPQHAVGILRGRGDGHRPAERIDGADQPQRVIEHMEVRGGDQRHQAGLLALRVRRGRPYGVRHAERFQGRQSASRPRLPGHVLLVERGGEARGIREIVQRLAPGTLVRRSEEDAVDVEDDGDQLVPPDVDDRLMLQSAARRTGSSSRWRHWGGFPWERARCGCARVAEVET